MLVQSSISLSLAIPVKKAQRSNFSLSVPPPFQFPHQIFAKFQWVTLNWELNTSGVWKLYFFWFVTFLYMYVCATAYMLALWLFSWDTLRCEFVNRKLTRHKAMCTVERGHRGLILQLMLMRPCSRVPSLVLQQMTYRNTVCCWTLLPNLL